VNGRINQAGHTEAPEPARSALENFLHPKGRPHTDSRSPPESRHSARLRGTLESLRIRYQRCRLSDRAFAFSSFNLHLGARGCPI